MFKFGRLGQRILAQSIGLRLGICDGAIGQFVACAKAQQLVKFGILQVEFVLIFVLNAAALFFQIGFENPSVQFAKGVTSRASNFDLNRCADKLRISVLEGDSVFLSCPFSRLLDRLLVSDRLPLAARYSSPAAHR